MKFSGFRINAFLSFSLLVKQNWPITMFFSPDIHVELLKTSKDVC